MLRPQGLFQNPQPKPFDWQQAYAPPAAPGTRIADSGIGQPTLPHGTPAAPAGYQPVPGAHQPGPYPAAAPYPAGLPPQTTAQPAAPGRPAPGYPPEGFPPPAAYPGQPAAAQYGQGQYQGAQHPTAHYPPAQYPAAQYGAGAYGQAQFPPPFPPGAGFGPDGSSPGEPASGLGRLREKLPKGAVLPVAVAGAAVLVVAGALVVSLQGGSSANNTAGTGTSATASPGTTSSSSGVSAAAAAAALNGLLQQSGVYRARVNVAVSEVQSCAKGLRGDARIFAKSAANRQTLLAKLQTLPGRQALPVAMLAHLTAAWQASVTVDTDLARWASGAARHCHRGNSGDPNLAAMQPYDSQATNDKDEFVGAWNRLAKKYGLPTYNAADI
jgi:hypothetical protein